MKGWLRSIWGQLVGLVIFWAAACFFFGFMGHSLLDKSTRDIARIKGREAFNKDQAFRLWGTIHGGVYVPVTEETPSNPYLSHIPERDISTASGRELTLLNPAYMVRQLNEHYSTLHDVFGHITSLTPLRPENLADPWERAALHRFEKGETEVSEFVVEGNEQYLRLMRPMYTSEGCLKCHAHQGYKVGDVRGGVSVKLPLGEVIALNSSQRAMINAGLPVLWAIGLVFILFGMQALGRAQAQRQEALDELTHESMFHDARARILRSFFLEEWNISVTAREVFDSALKVSGSSFCYISSIDPTSGDNIGHTLSSEINEGACKMEPDLAFTLPKGPDGYSGLWGDCLNSRKGFYTNDPASHPASLGIPEGHVILDNFLSVPVMNGGILLGQIALANCDGGYTDEVLEDVQLLADFYALGLNRQGTEERLRTAREEAVGASRAKSEFLANMSHEIRTPLNGVHGMLQLMHTTNLDAEQKEYVNNAINSSKRLTRLLSDILDLSRVEAGKLPVGRAPLSVGDVLEQVHELFEPSLVQTGLEMKSVVSDTIPGTLIGDETRLQQVLGNLVGNSLKFTRTGSITIEAYPLPMVAENKCRVLFIVSDSGPGIPDDKLGGLFKPFTQVCEGYRRNHQGAGLGLSITKRLVQLMGGNVAVDSSVGEGTSVYFSILFDLPGIESTDTDPGKESGIALLPSTLEGVSILMAEDEQVNSLASSRLLGKAGAKVTVVENGAKAVVALKEQPYDLVLMDIQMPVMDGVEATRVIRSGQAGKLNSNVPIIALTAFAMEGDMDKFLAAGMDGYLAKPVEIDALHEAITKVVKRIS